MPRPGSRANRDSESLAESLSSLNAINAHHDCGRAFLRVWLRLGAGGSPGPGVAGPDSDPRPPARRPGGPGSDTGSHGAAIRKNSYAKWNRDKNMRERLQG